MTLTSRSNADQNDHQWHQSAQTCAGRSTTESDGKFSQAVPTAVENSGSSHNPLFIGVVCSRDNFTDPWHRRLRITPKRFEMVAK